MRLVVPKLDRRQLTTPVVKFGRPERRPPVETVPGITAAEPAWDIGAGPWYYQGKQASSAEFKVLKTLVQLGWTPSFQVSKFGGRSLAGGQMLDILLGQHTPPVYIDVRGRYWHGGAEATANDARKLLQVRATNPLVKIIIIYDDETDNRQWLYNRLLAEVGAYGR